MHDLDTDAPTTIRLAFARDPEAVWTREGLASSYGVSLTDVDSVLRELEEAGILRRLDDEYVVAFPDL